ncbi:sel1 repeat family protein [Streptomyces sp. ISL-96]|uniref:tetratricopeptide repeat protein n=1 Tax=Streptomyces sp. ISL-96 TaxID=2819191 RepID=UPI001BE979E8|nr:tetratricopeptide repeat protein [Streptomyces sp. ISL-96]MBT2487480.1 sel1 repeat family protein [Streptomyces sp. ISL-96]
MPGSEDRTAEILARAEAGDTEMLLMAESSGVADRARWLLRAAQGESETGSRRLAQFRPALEEAARGGDADSQNVLGGVLLALDENATEAAAWFRKAADSGSNEARRSLGYLCVQGDGVAQDLAKARELFLAAASEGDVIAAHNLGVFCLEEGEGPPDLPEAIHWLRFAADGGVDEAAAKLGDVLSDLDRDEEALFWYERAAELGHIAAMLATGCWYRDGIGTSENRVVAVKWFLRMLEHHNFDGVHEVFQIAPLMRDSEIREGGRLAGREPEAEKIIQMCNSGAGHPPPHGGSVTGATLISSSGYSKMSDSVD